MPVENGGLESSLLGARRIEIPRRLANQMNRSAWWQAGHN